MEENKELDFDFSEEEILKFLERRQKASAKAKERGYGNYWEKQKSRMAVDPEYAARVTEQRKSYSKKALETQKVKMAADPGYAEKVKAMRSKAASKRREEDKKLLAAAKAAGLI